MCCTLILIFGCDLASGNKIDNHRKLKTINVSGKQIIHIGMDPVFSKQYGIIVKPFENVPGLNFDDQLKSDSRVATGSVLSMRVWL